MAKYITLLIFLVYTGTILHAQQAAKLLYADDQGWLRYQTDAGGNHLPDFSYAGYRNGMDSLPVLPVVKTIAPVAGDNTAHIQTALEEVAALPADANGLRGALLLSAGTYPVSGILRLRASGVVLRGVGQGDDPAGNTIIRGVGDSPSQRELIVVGPGGRPDWAGRITGSESVVTSPYVPAGSRSLEVATAEFFNVGDNIIITQPSTNAWLASISYGETAGDGRWQPGEIDLVYNRYVTDVNIPEGKITLDAPVFDHLERSLAQTEIYVLNEPNTVKNSGVENLQIFIETNGELSEEHAWTCIMLAGVEDAWVRDVTGYHFAYALVDMAAASRVTVRDCRALEPHSLIEGSRRYNFNVSRETNNVLFTNCEASQGRHSFVSNGTSSASGIVFHNSVSRQDYNSSEGHRRWSQGLLFDQLVFTDPNVDRLLGLYNRGDFGTGHGWSLTNSVAWNVRLPANNTLSVQRPPLRQNFAVGCFGNVTGNGPFIKPEGYIELTNQDLLIPSLYEAQLAQRLQRGPALDGPARLSASRNGGGVELNWLDIASRETGYVVVAYNSGDERYTVLDTLPANSTSYFDAAPAVNGEFYTYQVFAYGTSGPSPFSNPAPVDFVDGVVEATPSELRLVPNPVGDELNLISPYRLRRIIVYSAVGQVITRVENTHRLNTTGWKPGFYLLRVETTDGKHFSARIIKE